MSLTTRELETARDAALACARAAGQFLLDYCQPLEHRLPLPDPIIITNKASHDMRDLRLLVDVFAETVTQRVLRFIVLANSPRNQQAWFDGYQFLTFHEVACAAAEMTYVTLALLAEDLPQDTPDPAALATSFKVELLDHAKQYGDFRSDRVVSCIEQETAASIRYLADAQIAETPQVAGGPAFLFPSAPPSIPARDPALDARDKLFYDEWVKGTPWEKILKLYGNIAPDDSIETVGGVRRAVRRYAVRNNLPIPEPRRPGRRPL